MPTHSPRGSAVLSNRLSPELSMTELHAAGSGRFQQPLLSLSHAVLLLLAWWSSNDSFPPLPPPLSGRHRPQNCKLRAEKSAPPAAASGSWSPASGSRSPAVTPAPPATAASSTLFATAGKSAPVSPAARTSAHAAGLLAPHPCVPSPPPPGLINQPLAKAIAERERFTVFACDLRGDG